MLVYIDVMEGRVFQTKHVVNKPNKLALLVPSDAVNETPPSDGHTSLASSGLVCFINIQSVVVARLEFELICDK
jgi:hypothetical protein